MTADEQKITVLPRDRICREEDSTPHFRMPFSYFRACVAVRTVNSEELHGCGEYKAVGRGRPSQRSTTIAVHLAV